MFYFKLNHSLCEFDGDINQVFRALELKDGTYLISWKTINGTFEIGYTKEEIIKSITLKEWIITDENGE